VRFLELKPFDDRFTSSLWRIMRYEQLNYNYEGVVSSRPGEKGNANI